MDSLRAFLNELFVISSVPQSIIVISLVSLVGLLLARIRIARISLGVTFVFFVGILLSYWGITLEAGTLDFGMNFGLILFIYALGLQVGPAFFPSLKKGGIRDNLDSLLIVAVDLALVVGLFFVSELPISQWVGILSGATTNTPALAAAQSSLPSVGAEGQSMLAEMALACAITYPFGVVGVILALYVLAPLAKKRAKGQSDEEERVAFFSEYEVKNMGVVGKTISEVSRVAETPFVISRIWRDGKALSPDSTTQLLEGDRLLIVSDEREVPRLELFFGKKVAKDWNRSDIDWDNVDQSLVSRRLVLTRKEYNGVRLSTLHLRNDYGVNVTRIDRAGIELLTSPDLHLQLGDRMTVVGSKEATDAVAAKIGNEIKDLDAPNLLGLFIGLFISVFVGMIPFYIPGVSMPIRLGLAGGGIIIGILMGAFGPRITTYVTNSASLLVRQLGLILYLGCLGLSSGAGFFDILFSTQGLVWLGYGALLTVLPILLVGWYMLRRKRGDYATMCGVVCGSMANPMALEVVGDRLKGSKHTVAYATVYPLGMFVRIITAQLLILLFV